MSVRYFAAVNGESSLRLPDGGGEASRPNREPFDDAGGRTCMRWRTAALLTILAVAVTACSERSGSPSSTNRSVVPSGSTAKGPPPAPIAELSVAHDGRALEGNEWEIRVGERVEVVVTMTILDDRRTICATSYTVEKADGPSGHTLATLYRSDRRPSSSRSSQTLAWDGTDDAGARVPAGRYRLIAAVEVAADTCTVDAGVEAHGLGILIV